MPSWHDSVLRFSAVPAVAGLLLSPAAAWVWSRDGARLLWANPAGGDALGAATFSAAWARRWEPGHPLRREVVSLVNGMPDAGSLARLRISNRPSALPIACRCSRIRVGDARGVLVAALEGLPGFSPLEALASFFSDEHVTAVLSDDPAPTAGADPAAGTMETAGRFISLADAGQDRRLVFRVREHQEDVETAISPAGEPKGDEPQARPDERAEVAAMLPLRRGWEDTTAEPRAVEPLNADASDGTALIAVSAHRPSPISPPNPNSAPERAKLMLSRREPNHARSDRAGGRAGAEPDAAELPGLPIVPEQTFAADPPFLVDGSDAETLQPPPDEAAARSVTAGRVPRELSRRPVRFLWQTDASDRFLFVSPGLEQVVGRNAEIIGERWGDAASRLGLDPISRISRALAERDTWSGQTAWWPIEGSHVRVPAELTGLPIYGADHSFQGYRGFGVLRPAEALMPAAYEARFGRADQGPPRLAEQLPPYEESPTTAPAAPMAANVVPIRADLDRGDHVRLTPQERSAFEEIAAALRERVEASEFMAARSPGRSLPDADEPEPPGLGAGQTQSPDAASPQAGHHTPAHGLPPAREEADLPSFVEQPLPHPPQLAIGAGSADSAEPQADPERSKSGIADRGSFETPQYVGESARARTPEEAGEEMRVSAGQASLKPARAVPELWIAPPPPVPGAEAAQASPAAAPAAQPAAPRPSRTRSPGRTASGQGDTQRRLRELTAILDTATDGVVILDAEGTIESVNASAEALFGLDAKEMQGLNFGGLLTAGTRGAAEEYLSGLRETGVASLLNEGREVEARAGAGSIPLFMTMGRISNGDAGRFCAVLRDITHWKRTEAELVAAKRAAEAASNHKSEFLARVSHEIRTPLNAIIGFAEVMIEERFGPVENERYRDYLRDIRKSSEHVVSLVNDLLDISKIEAGKLDLQFTAVPLNDVVRECIAMMQPQAGRGHVVLRSSLSRDVPAIVADGRTLRQIVLNLLSNSVKFTGPGGQVIASTSLAETGEALLRIRDTGEGMSEEELARALEPFRQIATTTLADRTGTGLGLPLTKALVEANRATLAIRSARGEGTVVTITFPPTRVLSE